LSAERAQPSIMVQWAKYTQERGVSFAVYSKGLGLLLETDGYWLARGFAATLAAVENTTEAV
jgi:hypothetical protein